MAKGIHIEWLFFRPHPNRDDVLDIGADGVYVTGSQNDADRHIHVEYPHIGRMPTADLYTYLATKDYAPCYRKGRILPGMETLPFGFRQMGAPAAAAMPQPPPPPPSPPQPAQMDDDEEAEENDDLMNQLPSCSTWNRETFNRNYGL